MNFLEHFCERTYRELPNSRILFVKYSKSRMMYRVRFTARSWTGEEGEIPAGGPDSLFDEQGKQASIVDEWEYEMNPPEDEEDIDLSPYLTEEDMEVIRKYKARL